MLLIKSDPLHLQRMRDFIHLFLKGGKQVTLHYGSGNYGFSNKE